MKMLSESVVDNKNMLFFITTIIDDEGKEVVKTLSFTEYAALLESGVKVVKEYDHIGKMPYGYYDATFSDNKNFKIAVVYEEKQRGIRYFDKEYLVPHPNLVFYFSVSKGQVVEQTCYSFIDKPLQETTKLYRYPFGNVNTSGHICYGSIELPEISGMKDIDEVVDLFFFGKINDDYYSATDLSSCPNHSKMKQYKLLEFLTTRKKFPNKWLLPQVHCSDKKRQLTLADCNFFN